jgi:cytochrome c biogenesis protein CcmG, thiol:disulfide interchange protein DsbE
MTARGQWAVVLAVVALLGAGLWAATRFLGDELFPVTIGSEAPAFRAVALDGSGERTLADYEGQVVLLNIWATWCAPCREEMPSIQALHERYGPRGLKVVAVSIDQADAQPAIRAFAREFGLTFELLHEPTGAIQQAYQTTGVPETFIIGPDGVIQRKQVGHADWNSEGNRALVARLLGIPADTAAPRAGADSARAGA